MGLGCAKTLAAAYPLMVAVSAGCADRRVGPAAASRFAKKSDPRVGFVNELWRSLRSAALI